MHHLHFVGPLSVSDVCLAENLRFSRRGSRPFPTLKLISKVDFGRVWRAFRSFPESWNALKSALWVATDDSKSVRLSLRLQNLCWIASWPTSHHDESEILKENAWFWSSLVKKTEASICGPSLQPQKAILVDIQCSRCRSWCFLRNAKDSKRNSFASFSLHWTGLLRVVWGGCSQGVTAATRAERSSGPWISVVGILGRKNSGWQ